MKTLSRRVRIAFSALALMALPALAAAAPARPVKTATRISKDVDANDNGRLSAMEWKAERRERLIERFYGLDSNHSGTVSRFEAWKNKETRVLDHFAKIDVNDDGLISRHEFLTSPDIIWGLAGTQKFVKKYAR